VARTAAGGVTGGRHRDTEDYDGQSVGHRSEQEPCSHARSKHIKTKYHFIRECVDRGEVALESVGTVDQLVDILTKPLARVGFEELRGKIGVIKLTGH
jgi:hypothetical protein